MVFRIKYGLAIMLHEDIVDDANDKALALRNRIKYAANTSKRNKWKKAYKRLKAYKNRYKYLYSKQRVVEKAIEDGKRGFPNFVKSLKRKLNRANKDAYNQLSGSTKKGVGPLSQIELKKNPDGTITLNIPNSYKYNQSKESGYPYNRVAELIPYFDVNKLYANIPIVSLQEINDDEVRMVREYDGKQIYEGKPNGVVAALEEDISANTTKYYADYMDFDILSKLYTVELTIYITQLESSLKQTMDEIRNEGNAIRETKMVAEGIVKGDFNTILKATPKEKRERLEILKKESGVKPIVLNDDVSDEYVILYPLGGNQYIGVKGLMDKDSFIPYAKTILYDLESPVSTMPSKEDEKGVWEKFNSDIISTYIQGVKKKVADKEKAENTPSTADRVKSLLGKTKKILNKGIEFGKKGFTQKSFILRLTSIDSEMVDEVARILSEYENKYYKMLSETKKQIEINRSILKNP